MSNSFQEKLFAEFKKNNIFIHPNDINWHTNKFQRFRNVNSYGRGKPFFLILHGHYGASFGDWREKESYKTWWDKSYYEISYEEKLALKRQSEILKKEKILYQSDAIYRAKLLLNYRCSWRGNICKEASFDHPYVKKKKIIPYGAFQIRSYLILPIHTINGELLSLQYIKPNGFKQFKKNASPKNGFFYIGSPIKSHDILYVCEGWATGCSIYEAIGCNDTHVICSMCLSNMESITHQFKIHYPSSKIVLCADNDAHLSSHKMGNIGVKTVQKIARNYNTFLTYPSQAGDFNDLLITHGIEKVERELLSHYQG